MFGFAKQSVPVVFNSEHDVSNSCVDTDIVHICVHYVYMHKLCSYAYIMFICINFVHMRTLCLYA